MNKWKTAKPIICGLAAGFLNGLFGSGGGIIVIMFLRGMIKDERRAHATSTLIIFIMSLASLLLYYLGNKLELGESYMFLPGGALGAAAGAMWLKNIKAEKLRRIFGAAIAVSGVVMLFS